MSGKQILEFQTYISPPSPSKKWAVYEGDVHVFLWNNSKETFDYTCF